ncbi:MAG: s-methyl-5-thioribose-1-phosphate isomerase, partial [Planctomycetales bacterium]|nr:s-methyl-5-thioribose-1-phosphate isomerase [Planctomycetales bacterium]
MGLPLTLEWVGDIPGRVRLLDQTLLPGEVRVLERTEAEEVYGDIRRLAVRGAPAIGIAGAYGVALGAQRAEADDGAGVAAEARRIAARLGSARPTAVNLAWALARVVRAAEGAAPAGADEVRRAVLAEARAIHEEDRATCRAIGQHGAPLVPDGGTVLTHCNAGALATGGSGTALAVLFAAWEAGKRFKVLAGETRPLWQGARLTALELQAAGIPVTVIADSMAGAAMKAGRVRMVLVGADRIARNGDVA